jgi:tetratricopeptide (TPR) repeat protein
MADLDLLKDAMDQSTRLWRKGQHADALKLLDEWIAKAQQEKRGVWIKVLSMHASVISDSMGDLGLAKQYCEQVLAHEPENALALYSLADLLFRKGETHLAKEYAAKSYALAAHSNTKEDRGLFELLTQKWPQIAEWPR